MSRRRQYFIFLCAHNCCAPQVCWLNYFIVHTNYLEYNSKMNQESRTWWTWKIFEIDKFNKKKSYIIFYRYKGPDTHWQTRSKVWLVYFVYQIPNKNNCVVCLSRENLRTLKKKVVIFPQIRSENKIVNLSILSMLKIEIVSFKLD